MRASAASRRSRNFGMEQIPPDARFLRAQLTNSGGNSCAKQSWRRRLWLHWRLSPTSANAQNALGGAIVGGATGAVIGGAVGGGRGAAVGAAVGATTGAAVGANADGHYYYRSPPLPSPRTVGVNHFGHLRCRYYD